MSKKKRNLKEYQSAIHELMLSLGSWDFYCPHCHGEGGSSEYTQLDIDDYKDATMKTWQDCEHCNGTGLVYSDTEYIYELINNLHSNISSLFAGERENDIDYTKVILAEIIFTLFDYAEYKDINLDEVIDKELKTRMQE